MCWDTVDMSVSLPSAKLIEIPQLAHALLQRQPLKVHHDMSYLGKTTFCASGHVQLHQWCCVIQSDMLNVSNPPFIYFFLSVSSSCVSVAEAVSVATESSPLVISSS